MYVICALGSKLARANNVKSEGVSIIFRDQYMLYIYIYIISLVFIHVGISYLYIHMFLHANRHIFPA